MLPDLSGDPYRTVLARLHTALKPRTYFEIGTLGGATLALSKCASVAVDPRFVMKDSSCLLNKTKCLLFQQTSDVFFAENKLTSLFGGHVDFAFLDGMHKCEYLLRDFINTEKQCHKNAMIVFHDCIPTEVPMTGRDGIDGKPEAPHRKGWWTGDVWRTLWALIQFRPDLSITSLDAKPTGLILITNLHPNSTRLSDRYEEIENAMLGATLSDVGLGNWQTHIKVESTANYASNDQILAKFALDRH